MVEEEIIALWSGHKNVVATSGVRARILRGDILLIKRCLKKLGLFEDIHSSFTTGVERVVGKARTVALLKDGLEYLHRHIRVHEIIPIADAIKNVFRPKQIEFAKPIVEAIFNSKSEFYYCAEPIIRFHVPYDFVASHPVEARNTKQYGGGGKTGVHDPHTDSMVHCPVNSVNVWMALGRVRHGNGISIWPAHYRRAFEVLGAPRRGFAAPPGPPLNH